MSKVNADSFEGETPLKEFTENVETDRELSKQDGFSKMFYQFMQGEEWAGVVDNDTSAVISHDKEIGRFFHKDLHDFKPEILMTGSKEDEFVCGVLPTYFEQVFLAAIMKL